MACRHLAVLLLALAPASAYLPTAGALQRTLPLRHRGAATITMMAKKKKKKPSRAAQPPAASPPPPPPPAAAAGLLAVQVPVPEGMQAGDTFNFQVPDGREFSLTVPSGVTPGQAVAVEVPAAAAPPAAQTPTPQPEVPAVPFPLLVSDAPPPPPPPSAPRGPSRYAQGMDVPDIDVDVEVPQADLGLLAKMEEVTSVKLPSFDDYLRKGGAPFRPRLARLRLCLARPLAGRAPR